MLNLRSDHVLHSTIHIRQLTFLLPFKGSAWSQHTNRLPQRRRLNSCVDFPLPNTDWKQTMSEQFSENLIACLQEFVSNVNSDENVDKELVAAITLAAVDDFSKIAGIHELHTLMIREAFLPNLRYAISEIACNLASDSPELDEKLAFRSTTLKKYLTRFEPAIYGPISRHFMQKGAKEVSFAPKVRWAQTGTIAEVAYEDRRLKYFIKSNRTFYENEQVSHLIQDKVELVDYKELFVYCVLEKLGLGPKVEFIVAPEVVGPLTTDKTGLLIATLDVSTCEYDLPHERCKPSRTLNFNTCNEIIVAERNKLVEAGVADPAELERRLDARMEEIFSTPIAQRDLKTIDLLCRAMHLGFVLISINRGNFGRVVDATTGEEVGWRVVDFVIETVGLKEGVLQQTADAKIEPSIATSYRDVSGRLYYGELLALRNVLARGGGLGSGVKEPLLQGTIDVPPLQIALEEAWQDVYMLLEMNKEHWCMEEPLHLRKLSDLMIYARNSFVNVIVV